MSHTTSFLTGITSGTSAKSSSFGVAMSELRPSCSRMPLKPKLMASEESALAISDTTSGDSMTGLETMDMTGMLRSTILLSNSPGVGPSMLGSVVCSARVDNLTNLGGL